MARTVAGLPAGVRITDKVTLGVFAKTFPAAAIEEALRATDKASERNREMPNRLVIYFAMLMSLYRDVATGEVLRCMLEGLEMLLNRKIEKITGRSGISQARSRVSWEPLKMLFDSLAVPLAKKKDKGAFFQDLRVVSLDSTVFAVADEKENRKFFGKHQEGTAYPQMRVTALIECGTHAPFALTVAGLRVSEKVQAAEQDILSKLEPGMICLADRGFTGFTLFKQAAETGAKLLWRVRKDVILTPERSFSDGSYLAKIYCHLDRARTDGMLVRVIEYKVQNSKREEPIRLITNILDPRSVRALDLAELYAERWEFEMALDELKTHMLGNALTLRSKTPDLAIQELYGGFMAYYCVRSVMHEAACQAGLDDDELSFTHSVRVIRRKLPSFGIFPPGADSSAHHPGDTASACLV
jgi:hypothetical protein